ncbi:sugar transferase [Opitutales bacterium]|nr:sugar transferase [Opitutales bacterium]
MTRFFDILFSLTGILVLCPLLVPISILLLLTGEHKVFYKQLRVSQNGGNFRLIKFATMLEDSPNLEGGDITYGDDPRVLPVGKFLRKSKINELPQLLNIFLGDISIVGPRPLTPRNFEHYDQETQDAINKIKPGLTGVGSIVFRDEESIIHNSSKSPQECYKEDITPYKGELEKWFSQNQSLYLYFSLIFLTAWVVIFPKSKIVWKLSSSLPTPPDKIKKLLNFPSDRCALLTSDRNT